MGGSFAWVQLMLSNQTNHGTQGSSIPKTLLSYLRQNPFQQVYNSATVLRINHY